MKEKSPKVNPLVYLLTACLLFVSRLTVIWQIAIAILNVLFILLKSLD